MNVIYPLLATLVAIILWAYCAAANKPAGPKSGDRRIVKRFESYHLETYRDFPHWCGLRDFETLEAARAHLRMLEKPDEVVEDSE